MPDLLQRLQRALSERYRVDRQLGKGGMATVFLARDLKHRRPVAIKVLDPRVAAAIGEERFQREIETLAGLAHPHILPMHDSGVADGLLYFVMPFVEGESLRQRLEREKRLPVKEALRLAAEIADALGYAHRHGIVHRDVKPGNILLEEGHALLADFGIARASAGGEADTKSETRDVPAVTTTGVMVGTPTYMSPEQAGGARQLDGRSDQYALGCVLFEMLAGAPPFDEKSGDGVMRMHLVAPPPKLRSLRRDAGGGVERAIARALAKEPGERFPDALAFGAELRRLEREHAGPGGARFRSGRRVLVPVLAVAVSAAVVVAGAAYLLRGRTARPRGEDVRTVVVLPLANLSGDPQQQYFADGMTEELTMWLARLGSLKVISRTSAMAYRGSHKGFREIGRELGADGVIDGSVLRSGSRVRIDARLIYAPTNRELWSDHYEKDVGDVQALQQQVARAIAGTLQRELGRPAPGVAARAAPVDPAAHEAYLRGLYHWNRRTPEDLRIARRHFERATELDSSYALAWVGLSDTYGLMPQYDTVGVDEAMPRARAAALRALSLDSTLAEAYASLGNIEKSWTFDWDAAERHYRRAIALNPSYATSHHWYAVLLVWTDHVPDALAEIERASQLDPLSPIIQLTHARICYLARDYPRAAREYQETIDLDPARSSAWRGLSGVYYQQGRIREASTAWERAVALLPDSLRIPAAPVVTAAGDYLRRRLHVSRALARARIASSAEVAAVYADLGARDAAFDLLRSARMDELVLGDLRSLPDYDSLRTDPRYRTLESDVSRRQSAGRGARVSSTRT